MNNPTNPIIPPGSVLEQKNQGRARVRLAVFFVLAIHVVGLLGLLMVGCKKETSEPVAETNSSAPPAFDATNVPPEIPPTTTNASVPLPPPNFGVVTSPAGPTAYIVVKGDSFSTIASKFPGVKVKQIQEANPTVDPKKLQIGQKLQIPAPATAPSSTPAGSIEMSGSGDSTYTVKSGDNLTKIAHDFGTTVKAIRTANNLTTDNIKVGQKLTIPKAPATQTSPAPAVNPGM